MITVEEKVNDTPSVNKIRYEIEAAFIQIGIPNSLIGYMYTVDAISMVVLDRNAINSITLGIYGDLAARHNTSRSRVERAIRHLIETAYERGDTEKLEEYVGYPNAKSGKLANGEFIANFARTIWYKIYGYN